MTRTEVQIRLYVARRPDVPSGRLTPDLYFILYQNAIRGRNGQLSRPAAVPHRSDVLGGELCAAWRRYPPKLRPWVRVVDPAGAATGRRR